MRISWTLTGWQRLLVSLSAGWALFVVAAAAREGVSAALHSWLYVYEVSGADSLGLFPKLAGDRLAIVFGLPILLLWLVAGSLTWIVDGFALRCAAPLVRTGRLQDVLALIQVLALDEHAHRSVNGLDTELQGLPRSSASWAALAAEHPEFFRLHESAEHGVSLVARHVLPKNEQGKRELPPDFTGKLLGLAVDLHDRQLKRASAWEVSIPLLVAVIAGVGTLIGIALKP